MRALISLLVLPFAARAAEAGRPWAELAEQDLRAMHAQIRENHPGTFDTLNPSFKDWLEGGFRSGLKEARAARTPGAYIAVVRRYAGGFRDGHLGVDVTIRPTRVAWPGFIVGLRGDRFEVVALEPKAAADDPSLPPVGAVLKECDGKPPRAWVERDALPYLTGPLLERTWVSATTRLLQDHGYPGFTRANRCTFQTDGGTREITLRYRKVPPETIEPLANAAGFGAPPEMGIRRLGDGSVWVSIPTFHAGDDPVVLGRLQALIADAPLWRDARRIVFDLRGNSGGNSAFGSRILQNLYGDAFYRHFSRAASTGPAQAVDWRASKDNAAYMYELVRLVSLNSGPDSETTASFKAAAEGVNQAYRAGRKFWRREEPTAQDAEPASGTPPPPNPVRARVYLLTDGRCASACLDFADELLRQAPDVTHVGLMTSADSVYMEVRPAPLPSGAATLYLPVKVYRNRPRGHNEPYVPKHRFSGFIGDTAAVEKWLQELDVAR